MSVKEKVIAVVGPTASGKTALGVKIASELSGEVISADSMQIYKNMPIASAAPDVCEMCGIPHHLIGFAEPSHRFSVAEFVALARTAAEDIIGRGKTPVIVGGTGLYIDSFISGTQFAEEDGGRVRSILETEAEKNGTACLLERLRKIDPECAAKLHENDRKRIIRALEVYEIHGKTMTELNRLSKENGTGYDALWIGITFRDRARLYGRINRRVDQMMEKGLLDEARNAFANGGASTSVQAIGHKEFFPYFKGETTLAEAVERLKAETRRYAKRQLTWFRKNSDINWIYADETDDVASAAMRIIKQQ